MAKDPKTEFKAVYEAYGRKDLARAGQEFLGGNLRLQARRHARWFWIGFAIALALAVWLSILGIVYLLERARESANRFEHQRRESLDRNAPD